jgi:hypothetical protein
MPFEVHIHPEGDVIEVVYPADSSATDVAEYATKMRAAIDSRSGPWSCLVDQRKMKRLGESLLIQVQALNRHAQEHGMVRSARVVASVEGVLQSTRLATQGGLSSPLRTFASREKALAWLRSPR